MELDEKIFVQLVNEAIGGKKCILPEDKIDWRKFLIEAKSHNLAGILYPAIANVDTLNGPGKEFIEEWKQIALLYGGSQLSKNMLLSTMLKAGMEKNIHLVVVKGIVLADLYPDSLLRVSGDADIFVPEEEIETAREILIENNFTKNSNKEVDCEETYYHKNGLVIELHSRLWEEKEGRKLQILESMNITQNEKLCKIKIGTDELWTLGVTEHFIYLIYHMVKHFFVSGIGLRHLTDIVLYMKKYKEKIDFEYFWRMMEKLEYTEFCVNVFYLCVEYFELDESAIPEKYKRNREIEESILNDILAAGVFGGKTIDRWKSGRILRTYYENEEKKAPKNKFWLLIKFLFPKQQELSHQAVENQEYSSVIVIAWFQRIFYLLKKWKKDKRRCSMKKRVDCASDRIELLKKINLIKD